ncbi:MAG: hypothetical protein ACOYMC_15270, partial [Pirellulales bacterium]
MFPATVPEPPMVWVEGTVYPPARAVVSKVAPTVVVTDIAESGSGAVVLATGSTGIGVDAGMLTISRTISGTGGLVKTGSGRLVLAGPASY